MRAKESGEPRWLTEVLEYQIVLMEQLLPVERAQPRTERKYRGVFFEGESASRFCVPGIIHL